MTAVLLGSLGKRGAQWIAVNSNTASNSGKGLESPEGVTVFASGKASWRRRKVRIKAWDVEGGG